MGLDLHTCGPPISPPWCLKQLSRASQFFQSVSATNSCKISCNLEGDAHTTPPRPVCSFVLAALPVQTVRFLEYAHEDRPLALASVVV
jgi:hypothetical protein